MNRLEEAAGLPENQDPIRQFAIRTAKLVLVNADVKDPGMPSAIEKTKEVQLEEKMLSVFKCLEEQIAHNPSEINDNTKAYVGSLAHYDANGRIIPLFKKIGHLEHVYTSFPEGRIIFEDVEIGGKTREQLEEEMTKAGIKVSSYAQDMMRSKDFTTLKKPQTLRTARLKVKSLGFSENEFPTTDQVYARTKDLGLDRCPAELGPHKRLKDIAQSMNSRYSIAMEQITGRRGIPLVFDLERHGDGLWLHDSWTFPASGWRPEDELVLASKT